MFQMVIYFNANGKDATKFKFETLFRQFSGNNFSEEPDGLT